MGILDAAFDNGDGTAIVKVDYTDSGVAGGYRDEDVAFVYTPAWFTDLGPDVEVAATVGTDDFLISGYWPGWEASGAAGQPIVVSGDTDDTDVTTGELKFGPQVDSPVTRSTFDQPKA